MTKIHNEKILQFFTYEHLPEHLQAVNKPFCEMAENIVETLPFNPERIECLKKLLEAKDCAVRALLYSDGVSSNKETSAKSNIVGLHRIEE